VGPTTPPVGPTAPPEGPITHPAGQTTPPVELATIGSINIVTNVKGKLLNQVVSFTDVYGILCLLAY